MKKIISNSNIVKFILGAMTLLPVLFFQSCKKSGPTRPVNLLEARGKSSYVSNCIACHNQDPRMVGSVGPDIAGSSLELITARVIHQSYPAGYRPKRNSKLMPPLPFLETDLPALHAYLNSFIKK